MSLSCSFRTLDGSPTMPLVDRVRAYAAYLQLPQRRSKSFLVHMLNQNIPVAIYSAWNTIGSGTSTAFRPIGNLVEPHSGTGRSPMSFRSYTLQPKILETCQYMASRESRFCAGFSTHSSIIPPRYLHIVTNGTIDVTGNGRLVHKSWRNRCCIT